MLTLDGEGRLLVRGRADSADGLFARHEWTVSVEPAEVSAAVAALGGTPGQDPLVVVAPYEHRSDLGDVLEAAGVDVDTTSRWSGFRREVDLAADLSARLAHRVRDVFGPAADDARAILTAVGADDRTERERRQAAAVKAAAGDLAALRAAVDDPTTTDMDDAALDWLLGPPEVYALPGGSWFANPAAWERELRREIAPGHPLWGHTLRIVPRRLTFDDVLVMVAGDPVRYAVTHLTWQGPQVPPWPSTGWLGTPVLPHLAPYLDDYN